MSTDHRFDPYGDDSPVRRRSWLSTCLFGCLIIAVVGVVLAAIAAYWISQNWRGFAVSFAVRRNQSIDRCIRSAAAGKRRNQGPSGAGRGWISEQQDFE